MPSDAPYFRHGTPRNFPRDIAATLMPYVDSLTTAEHAEYTSAHACNTVADMQNVRRAFRSLPLLGPRDQIIFIEKLRNPISRTFVF